MAQLRKTFNIPRTNVGLGGFVTFNNVRYHTPSWTVVEADTTFDDLILEAKPFSELFDKEEEKLWKFKSASSDKEYTVRLKRDGSPYCDCWGYIGHKKCKHVKEVLSYD